MFGIAAIWQDREPGEIGQSILPLPPTPLPPTLPSKVYHQHVGIIPRTALNRINVASVNSSSSWSALTGVRDETVRDAAGAPAPCIKASSPLGG